MCQRVVIALALACRPQLLIADEPTTGLDVTTQKAVMDLVVELTRERGMSTILITHDLGLAAAYCDRVVVMEKGRVVETATSETIFKAPSHAYTRKADAGDAAARRVVARSFAGRGSGEGDRQNDDSLGRTSCGFGGRESETTMRGAAAWWSKGWSRNIRATSAPARLDQDVQAASRRLEAGDVSRRRRHQLFDCVAAKALVWSANPAAANPPPR